MFNSLRFKNYTFDEVLYNKNPINLEHIDSYELVSRTKNVNKENIKDRTFVISKKGDKNFLSGVYIYCNKCKSFERAHIIFSEYNEETETNTTRNLKDYYNGENIFADKILCPNCNNEEMIEDLVYIKKGSIVENTFRQYEKVFDNGDKIKLSWADTTINLYNSKPIYTIKKSFITMNVKTGQSYLFAERVNNKQVNPKTPRIINITYPIGDYKYNLPAFKEETKKELFRLIYKKKCEILGYNPPTIYDYENKAFFDSTIKTSIINDFSLLSDIIIYNRLPNLNIVTLKRAFPINNSNRALRRIKANSDNPLGELINSLKLPNTKSIRKALSNDVNAITDLIFFGQIIKEPNNLVKILQSKMHIDNNLSGRRMKLTKNFVETMIDSFKKNGETIVTNKLLNVKAYILSDTAALYFNIMTSDPTLPLSFNKSIKEMHDEFSIIQSKMKIVNKKFVYDKEDYKLEDTIDGYDFILAPDSHSLKVAGIKMKICVGGYIDDVLEGLTNIVLVTKKNKHTMCLELSSDLKSIRQAKMPCNFHPKGKDLDVLMQWIKKNKLIVQTYDIPKVDEYYKEEHDNLEETDLEELKASGRNFAYGLNDDEAELIDFEAMPVRAVF